MAQRADLGWWGEHPYVYVAFTTTAAIASWAAVVVAASGAGGVGLGLCGGLFGVLMTIAAVHAWHWLLRGRHRGRRANERMRWKWDVALIRGGLVLLWVIFLGLLLATGATAYVGWRFDRYGVPAEAVVTEVGDGSVTVSVATRDGARAGVLQTDSGDPPLLAGDAVAVVYDPEPGAGDVIRAGQWPYDGVIPLAVGTVVAGLFVVVPPVRRRLTHVALARWREPNGRIRPPD